MRTTLDLRAVSTTAAFIGSIALLWLAWSAHRYVEQQRFYYARKAPIRIDRVSGEFSHLESRHGYFRWKTRTLPSPSFVPDPARTPGLFSDLARPTLSNRELRNRELVERVFRDEEATGDEPTSAREAIEEGKR